MYLEHFHLTHFPFSISPDPHFMYMSKRHQEGLAHLLYGIKYGGGFVALTGEVGTGKTTLCHCLLQQLPENIDLALVLNSRLTAKELVATLCDELSIVYDKSSQSLKYLIDKLNHHLLLTHAKGRETVLLIDEAQNLSMDVLEQLRLLTNLETSKAKLLRIILVGQPELKDLLQRQVLRQLNQRITARYHLQSLSLKDTRAYIKHRLSVSHGDVNLFNERAICKIFQFSLGVPRLINLLCDRALLGAYATHVQKVNSAIVVHAAEEVLPITQNNLTFKWLHFVLFLLGIFGFLVVAQQNFDFIKSTYRNTWVIKTIPTVSSLISMPKIETDVKPIKISAKDDVTTSEIMHSQSFSDWISNPNYALDTALIDIVKDWGKSVPNNQKLNCNTVQITGLRCVLGKMSWKELIALNKPVILEFVLNDKSKHHTLLTGFSEQQTEVLFTGNTKFSSAEILKFWDGYYLILEPPVLDPNKTISYQQNSDNVLWLRYVLNSYDGISCMVKKPYLYDEKLMKRVKFFQQQHQITANGNIGPKTLLGLKNYAQTLKNSNLVINE